VANSPPVPIGVTLPQPPLRVSLNVPITLRVMTLLSRSERNTHLRATPLHAACAECGAGSQLQILFCSNNAVLFARLFYPVVLAEHWLRNEQGHGPSRSRERHGTEEIIMWAQTRQGKFHVAHTRLSLEQLEARQLMAADALASALSSTDTSTSSTARIPAPTTSSQVASVRTFDGTGNNLTHSQWGSTGEELLRKAAAEYGDGIYTLAGADRPSPRVISNAIAAQETTDLSNRDLSAFIYVWGQFLDHDIDLTSTGTTAAAIAVPKGDAQFDPTGSDNQTIDFFRSLFNPTSGTSTANPREQITDITS
jgi:hypothetical protein